MAHRSILLLTGLMLASCNNVDKPCIAPGFKDNIIGSWNATWDSSPEAIRQVKFGVDGSYLESEDLLLGSYNSPIASWRATNDSLEVVVKFKNQTSASYHFLVKENTCDEVLLDLEGLERIKLARR